MGPFILDMEIDISGSTMNFDMNVKVAHQEIKCPTEAIAVSATEITFPNIGNTGDCMGDALRGQKKDVSKFNLKINSDGTLTFNSDGWPPLKMKPVMWFTGFGSLPYLMSSAPGSTKVV